MIAYLKENAKRISLWILSILIPVTFAAELTLTPRGPAAQDVSVLRAFIAADATSLTLEPVKKFINGVEVTGCFNTGSGFLLVEDFGGKYEYMSFGANACSSANVTTLSSLRRGLNPESTTGSLAAGVGLSFDAGASVRVVDFPTYYANSIYLDSINILTNSGALYTTTIVKHPIFTANTVTTTQRDAMNSQLVRNGSIIYNSTTGTMQQRTGGVWSDIGSIGTPNASTTVAGRTEEATSDEILNATATGSEARLFVSPLYLTGSKISDIGAIGLIPLLGTGALQGTTGTATGGVIIVQLGGTSRSYVDSGALLLGNGTGALDMLLGSASGQVVSWNNDKGSWVVTDGGLKAVEVKTGTSTVLTSPSSAQVSYTSLIGTGSVTAGKRWWLHVAGNYDTAGANDLTVQILLNDVASGNGLECLLVDESASASDGFFSLDAYFTADATGASAVFDGTITCQSGEGNGSTVSDDQTDVDVREFTVNTTQNIIVRMLATLASGQVSINDWALIEFP